MAKYHFHLTLETDDLDKGLVEYFGKETAEVLLNRAVITKEVV